MQLGLAPALLQVLTKMNIAEPTPIQRKAIPLALDGKDIMGIAQTGTGKTWAFGLPLLQRLAQHGGRALIVLPTRELAYQVEESLRPFAQMVGIGIAVFVGGAPMSGQLRALKQNPRILVATPGRLNDHLEQRTVTLKEVKILVLDEADQMLDMGFKPQIDRIIQHVPADRQTLLFSATMPGEIVQLATRCMKLPLRIEVAPAGTAAEKVEQEVIIVDRNQKLALLIHLLAEHRGSVLVFSRTKHGARKMTKALQAASYAVTEIHSDRTLPQRRAALEGFRNGRYRVLIATDIAARGIDVSGIELVVNYDLPDDASDYIHRIGRTARAGRTGKAISFACPDQRDELKRIERLTRVPLPRRTAPVLAPLPANMLPPMQERGDRDDRRDSSRQSQFGSRPSGAPPRHRSGGGGGHRFNKRRY